MQKPRRNRRAAMQTSIVAPPLAAEIKRTEQRIAELESALDEIRGVAYAMSRGINGGVTTMCVPIGAWDNAMKARNPK